MVRVVTGDRDGGAVSADDLFSQQFDSHSHAATTNGTNLIEVELILMHRYAQA